MKDKLKTFYEKNKENVILTAKAGAACVGACALIVITHLKTVDSERIVQGGMLENGQDDTFVVRKKNGKTSVFTRPQD